MGQSFLTFFADVRVGVRALEAVAEQVARWHAFGHDIDRHAVHRVERADPAAVVAVTALGQRAVALALLYADEHAEHGEDREQYGALLKRGDERGRGKERPVHSEMQAERDDEKHERGDAARNGLHLAAAACADRHAVDDHQGEKQDDIRGKKPAVFRRESSCCEEHAGADYQKHAEKSLGFCRFKEALLPVNDELESKPKAGETRQDHRDHRVQGRADALRSRIRNADVDDPCRKGKHGEQHREPCERVPP